jgi:hypothetical protein
MGRTAAMLYNAAADRGLALRWNIQELPCFTVWKNTGAVEDGYVTGLEPATNFPNFKTFERQQGRVRVLPAGASCEFKWSVEIFETAASVSKMLGEIIGLQAHARATIHRAPQAKYSNLERTK